MADQSSTTVVEQRPYLVPEYGCGGRECVGPEPVPWLPWRHCFRMYEFRYGVVPVTVAKGALEVTARPAKTAAQARRTVIRVRYEHQLCVIGRKQGPIVHSLTLLPKEQLRIYEFDRYKQATKVENRLSVRSSFFTQMQRVQNAYSSIKADAGGSLSTSSSVGGGGGGGIDLGIISFGGSASASSSVDASTYFDVASVSEQFSHVAETTSHAVESERSIVVSTFEEQENAHSTARMLRNDNECKAVTYYMRRVFEIYSLSTRIVAIEVQVGGMWVYLEGLPGDIRDAILKLLRKDLVGSRYESKVEIALPTDGLLYEAELAHCCSCDSGNEARIRLELEKLQLENLNLRLEAARRQKRLDAGDLDPFEPAPAAAASASEPALEP